MKAKTAVECAELLKTRFADVVIDATGPEAVVHARGHHTAFPLRRCGDGGHIGPLLRVNNVTAIVSSGIFSRTSMEVQPRRYSEIIYCRKCESVLSYELEKIL